MSGHILARTNCSKDKPVENRSALKQNPFQRVIFFTPKPKQFGLLFGVFAQKA